MGTGFIILIVLIAVIVGAAIGTFLGRRKADRRFKQDTQYTQGRITIDNSCPDYDPELFLALNVPVESIMSRNYIRLDIKVVKHDSHE